MEGNCQYCGQTTTGKYCSYCGQDLQPGRIARNYAVQKLLNLVGFEKGTFNKTRQDYSRIYHQE